VQHTKLASC